MSQVLRDVRKSLHTSEAGREAPPSQAEGAKRGRSGPGSRGKEAPHGAPKSSHVIEEQIDIGVPRQTAYDQWTHYKDLPKYSKKESAEQRRPERLSFTSKIGPSTRRWEVEVVEQVPPRRIAWRSVGGAKTMGVVTFHALDDRLTRMMVEMEYHPSGAMETVGNFFRMPRRRVRKDLRLFKHYIELQGKASGKGAAAVGGKGLKDEADERVERASAASETGRS